MLGARRFLSGRRTIRSPGVLFLTRAETGEIAAAGGAPVGSGAAAQQDYGPAGRVIVLFAPGAQILAVAARAAGEFPGSVGPDAGPPARTAPAAAQRINSEERLDFL